jgi:hypothetical protein
MKQTIAGWLLNYESSNGKSIHINIVEKMAARMSETTLDDNRQKEDLDINSEICFLIQVIH